MYLYVLICIAVALDAAAGDSNRLQGQHLNVIAVHMPPMMFVDVANGQFAGPVFQHVDWLSKRLHFSYTLQREENNAIGVKSNGTWNGMMALMKQQKADLAAYPFYISLDRSDAVQYVGFFGGDENALLTKYPTPTVAWTAVCQPFSVEAWTGWLMSFIAISVACVVLLNSRRVADERDRLRAIDDMLMFIFGAMLAQGVYYRSKAQYVGLVAISWCFAAFVFVNVYNSMLTSTLATLYKSPEINSVQQLADSATHQMVTLKGIFPDLEVLAAQSGPLRKIGDKLRQCADCRMPPSALSSGEMERRILQGQYIGITPSKGTISVMQANYRRNKTCQLTLAQERYGWRPLYLGLSKWSPYVEEINRESLWAHAFGLPFYWNSYPARWDPCFLRYNKKGVEVQSSNQPLTLRQFSLAFVILLVGVSASLAAFIYEFIVSAMNRSK